MKYYIHTFGCQQNIADSERIAGYYESRGFSRAEAIEDADIGVINTCVIRQQAEDRAYSMAQRWTDLKVRKPNLRVVVTGCLIGAAARETSGARMQKLHDMMPGVDEFVPIDEIGFEYPQVRANSNHALIPISQGCNNFCTFCIVPLSRGKETSRPFADIVSDVQNAVGKGSSMITLLGQNVNSYGSDFMRDAKAESIEFELPTGERVRPVYVKHLGRYRIPTLFPYLLETVARIPGVQVLSFIAANPWDYSDELIDVIARNTNISRTLHLPVQSGDNNVLQRMNRWYTREEYLNLLSKIRERVPGVEFTSDIIVGFPGETDEEFRNTVELVEQAGFVKAFVSCYSPRTGTAAAQSFSDTLSPHEKKRRFHILDQMINHKVNLEDIPWLGYSRKNNLLAVT